MPDPIVEILTKGATYPEWTDITADVRGAVSWRRGIPSNRATADASTCDLTLDNLTGKYNPRNPASPIYGSVGFGTPVRVRLDETAPALPSIAAYTQTSSTTSSITVTTPASSPGDLLVLVLMSVGASTVEVPLPDASWESQQAVTQGGHRTTIAWAVDNSTNGPAVPSTFTLTLAASGTTTATRAVFLAVTDVAQLRPIVAISQYGSRPPIVPAPRGLSIYGAWTSASASAYTPVAVSAVWDALDADLGTTWSAQSSNASTASLPGDGIITRENPEDLSFDVATAGTYNDAQFESVLGHNAYFSIAVYAGDDPAFRYVGEATEWEQSWESAGADATANPNTQGVFANLAKGLQGSALSRTHRSRGESVDVFRATSDYQCLGYWPLEADFGNAIENAPAAFPSVEGMKFASSTCPGTSGLVEMQTSGTADTVQFPVTYPVAENTNQYAVELLLEFPTDAATGDVLVLESLGGLGYFLRLTVTLAATTFSWTLVSVDKTTSSTSALTSASGYARRLGEDWHHLRLTVTHSLVSTTLTTTYQMIVDGVYGSPINSATIPGSVTLTQPSGVSRVTSRVPFGHVNIEVENLLLAGRPLVYENTWVAVTGFMGESPGSRVGRVCIEGQRFPEVQLSSNESRIRMGPQNAGSTLGILESVGVTDAGLVTESTQRLGVRYNTRASLYHRPPIELDYEDSTILDRQLEPYDDDALITNRVAMTDTGSDVSTTQTETEGPLAAVDAPDGIGVRTTSPTVSLRHSALLEPVAQWALAQGTVDAPYFRTLGFNLVKIRDTYGMTALADALEAANIGDHVWIENPPVWLPRGTNKLVITEAREELSAVNHTLAFAARPGELFGPGLVGGVSYLNLPGASGDFAWAPDATGLDVTGDISLVCDVALDDWTPSSTQTLIGKYQGGQQSFLWRINTGGAMNFITTADGSTIVTNANSTVAVPNVVRQRLRVDLDVNDGAGNRVVRFYTDTGSGWVQLGTTVTTAGATTIFNGTARLTVGAWSNTGASDRATGKIYSAEVYNGIGGTLVANPRFDIQPDGTTSFNDTQANPWTVAGAATTAGDSEVDVKLQRVDSDGSTFGATADDNDTTITVYTDLTDFGTRPWTTDTADCDNTAYGGGGLRIRANGEVIRVTNIAADAASIAHDAATEPATFTTVTPLTFTHTPAGTPKGVLVFIDHGTVSTDLITSVTYGGVDMTRVRTAADTATEAGRVYVYFLGTGIPTGAQTVSIVHTGSADVKHAVSVTLTALGDTQVRATTNLEGDQANPAATLDPDERMALHYCVAYSGAAATTDLTALSGMTAVHSHDFGAFVSRVDRQTTAATTAFPIGYTATSDDVAFVAIQVGTVTASQAFTITRGVDGFATSHAIGDSVAIAHPARVGL